MSRGTPFWPRPYPDDMCHRPCPPPCPPLCPQPRAEPEVRVRLFDRDMCGRNPCCERDLPPAAPPVTIVNPWNCRERAVVILSVDECGNLVVCIKRER